MNSTLESRVPARNAGRAEADEVAALVLMAAEELLFLDIDGVLNGHDWDEGAQSNRIRYQCVRELNRIIAETGAKVVLSSAWRYMIHGRQMTLAGFGYLLRTHGASCLQLVGLTEPDEVCPLCGNKQRLRGRKRLEAFDAEGYRVCIVKGCGGISTRGAQVTAWLNEHSPATGWPPYVVIDDDDLGFTDIGHPFVQTNGETGLTASDGERAIELLTAAGVAS